MGITTFIILSIVLCTVCMSQEETNQKSLLVTSVKSDCCGRSPYDHVRKICCNNIQFNRPQNARCCMYGTLKPKVYDSIRQICCQGVVFSRPSDARCCRNKAYDSKYFSCCLGKLIRIPENIRYQPACCGYTLYSHATRRCCGGVIVKRAPDSTCCGTKYYNYRKYICCNGNVSERPPNAQCCKDKPYDTLKQSCCYGRIFERPNNA